MTNSTYSTGLAHSYIVLESWLASALHNMHPSTSPDIAIVKKQAHQLRTAASCFSITYQDRGHLPDAIARCLLIVERVARSLIDDPTAETELKAADLAVKLITPLNRAFQSIETSTTKLGSSVEYHAKTVQEISQLGNLVLGKLSRIPYSSSPLIALIAETIQLALTDFHIDSLITSRIILVSQQIRSISEEIADLESFYTLKTLNDPEDLIAALERVQRIQSLCSELAVEVSDLDTDIGRELRSINEKNGMLKFQIFQKYLSSTCALLPDLTRTSYSKDLASIQTVLLNLALIINCAATLENRCKHMFGSYDGPEEIGRLYTELVLHKDHLLAAELECSIDVMEGLQKDFPSLRDIQAERQQQITKALHIIKSNLPHLQQCFIRSGLLPSDLGGRILAIEQRLFAFKSWVERTAKESETLQASSWLRRCLTSLSEIHSEE